jgi:hypothetical protein
MSTVVPSLVLVISSALDGLEAYTSWCQTLTMLISRNSARDRVKAAANAYRYMPMPMRARCSNGAAAADAEQSRGTDLSVAIHMLTALLLLLMSCLHVTSTGQGAEPIQSAKLAHQFGAL